MAPAVALATLSTAAGYRYAGDYSFSSAVAAAIDGTIEVAPAVISSVLTSVIAFIPLASVTGPARPARPQDHRSFMAIYLVRPSVARTPS